MKKIIIDVKRLVEEAEKLSRTERSYWKRGVASLIRDYAEYVLKEHDGEEVTPNEFYRLWNCGADTLEQSVYGGDYDIWDGDIARRLCTPSELKKKDDGRLEPNVTETWLDVELRAVYRAVCLAWTILAR